MQIWLNEKYMSAVDSNHAHVLKEIVIWGYMSPVWQPAGQLWGGWPLL